LAGGGGGALAVLGDDDGVDPAAHGEVPLDAHPARAHGGGEVVEEAVADRRGGVALVAERPKARVHRLQLDARLAGDVADAQESEVGLAGLRNKAGEVGALEADLVAPRGLRVLEGVEVLLRLAGHRALLSTGGRCAESGDEGAEAAEEGREVAQVEVE